MQTADTAHFDISKHLSHLRTSLAWHGATPTFTPDLFLNNDPLPEELQMPDGNTVKTVRASPGEFLRFNYPHGIDWHTFPILSDAQYRLDGIGGSHSDRYIGTIDALIHVLDGCEFIVYDEFNSRADHHARYMTSVVHAMCCPQKRIMSRFEGEIGFRERTGFDLATDMHVARRLEYSFAINFLVIGGKALRHVQKSLPEIPEPGLKHKNLRTYAQRLNIARKDRIHLNRHFGYPSYIQYLFGVRDLDREEQCRWFRRYILREGPRPYPGIGRYFTEDGLHWKGTGKYAPIPTPWCFDGFTADGLVEGLIEVSFDDEVVRLSEAGKRFLGILHPDNEDPDCMLRWGNPTWDPYDGGINRYKQKSVDDWVLRFFRKMKVRVNAL